MSLPPRRRVILFVSAAISLGVGGSLGGASAAPAAGSGALVAYREEGGLGGPKASLVVSTHREATVRVAAGRAPFTTREVRFRLDTTTWRALRRALRNADLNALAKRPTTKPYPDAITYVIIARQKTIRASDGAIPIKLAPLIFVLRHVVRLGEQRASRAG